MKVLVAMSGGVDSSVAANLLVEQGYECIGCTMRLYENDMIGEDLFSTCCSKKDTDDARKVTEILGIPYYIYHFENKFIEIRPSGTDAKTKAYGAGNNKEEIKLYAKTLGNYSGELTPLYQKYISQQYYENVKDKSMEKYLEFTNKDANNDVFEIPDYRFKNA